uniref:Uncharacterized protein n=1 Tax=Oryza nivara TaxID=4536 RepID=A0A0E0FNY5_ORYNI
MASWEDEPSGGSREPSEPSGCTDLIMPPLRPESPPELLDRLLLHDEEEETTSYVASAHPAPIEYGSDDDAGLTRFVDDMYSCVELDDVVDKETVCPVWESATMASDLADLLHISWPHLPDQCGGEAPILCSRARDDAPLIFLVLAAAVFLLFQVQIIQQETKDKLCWKFTNNGICSTKSAYKEVYKREISNAHQEDLDEEDTNRRMSHNHNGSITFEGELLAFQLAMEIARFLKFTFSQIVPSSRGHLQEKKLSRRTRALELKANLEPNLYEKVNWIPRELNKLADKLAKEAKSQLCLNPTYSCQNISHIALSQQEMLC